MPLEFYQDFLAAFLVKVRPVTSGASPCLEYQAPQLGLVLCRTDFIILHRQPKEATASIE